MKNRTVRLLPWEINGLDGPYDRTVCRSLHECDPRYDTGGGFYYRHIMPYGIEKFKRFAVNVWDVDPEGKSDEQTAEEGLKAMESWMRELGLVMNISELGASEEMIDGIADGTLIMQGGYKILDRDEVKQILIESM